jgi:HK97 gp10 family phage protein
MADLANVSGLSELKAALLQLPKEIQGKVLGSAVKKGADMIRNQARSNHTWRDKSGLLSKAIVSYRNKSSTQDRIQYDVGVTMKVRLVKGQISRNRTATKKILRVGEKADFGKAYYWRFQEFGTKKMGARPFIRPAFEGLKSAAVEQIKTSLAAAIDKAAAKLGRK